MNKAFSLLAFWFCFWGCVETLGLALYILDVLPSSSKIVEFSFAMAILTLPVAGLVYVICLIWSSMKGP